MAKLTEKEKARRKTIAEKKLKLAEEIAYLYAELDKPLDKTSEGLLAALDFRCQWLSRSAQIVAECEVLYDAKKGEVAECYFGTEESWNTIKQVIESQAGEEKRLYLLADRLNATVTHSLDAVRSLVSYEKQERANSNFSYPQNKDKGY